MQHDDIILAVNDLAVEFDTYGGKVQALRGVSFNLKRGRTLAIVGESGCGKSVSVQAMMGLIPMPPGRITRGSAIVDGQDLIGLDDKALNRYRGRRIGMIFQDPMSALNPTMAIGRQIAETLQVHRGMGRQAARAEVLRLLKLVQIPEAEKRSRQYPFEFSGGMLQRVMIAMSLACSPDILIADEPTTALDVTIQAQILDLLQHLQTTQGLSIILITHDLGVVAKVAHDVAVMYAGQVVEQGSVDDIFSRSAHPYTAGLKRAMPSGLHPQRPLQVIEGAPPDLFSPPPGCAFAQRCPQAMRLCHHHQPPLFSTGPAHQAACWLQHPQAPQSHHPQGDRHAD